MSGGHTFGKAHGAADAGRYVGPEPEGAQLEEQGLGWKGSYGTGKGGDSITSGLEGAWTVNPTQWDNNFLEHLHGYTWEKVKSPAGAVQWAPKDGAGAGTVPDAHDPSKTHAPMMLTTDLSLREDPAYAQIAKRFMEDPDELADAFARAWYKLTHRDMGPIARYRGSMVPEEPQLWQDPIPSANHDLIDSDDINVLKSRVLASKLSISDLVSTAWASASTYRGTDKRGGANGARIRLAPQKDWEVNEPARLKLVLEELETIQQAFNIAQETAKRVSLADLIVLGGCAAIEQAAKNAGHNIEVPFAPGRTDALKEHTDVESFAVLEPRVDGFRNYGGNGDNSLAAKRLVDRADLLTLTANELTALVGGLRVLGANHGQSTAGVFTDRPATLTNDFFVNLMDMDVEWHPSEESEGEFEGCDRQSGELRWTATGVDLIFGSNSELRAFGEIYACADGHEAFVRAFVAAWTKVMNLDRFDLA